MHVVAAVAEEVGWTMWAAGLSETLGCLHDALALSDRSPSRKDRVGSPMESIMSAKVRDERRSESECSRRSAMTAVCLSRAKPCLSDGISEQRRVASAADGKQH